MMAHNHRDMVLQLTSAMDVLETEGKVVSRHHLDSWSGG